MLRAKYFALILLGACVLFMSGGCGGDPSPIVSSYIPEDANAVWDGAWIAQNGTASVKAESVDLTLTVQNIAAVFYSSDVEGDSGTSHMAALVILSGDIYFPMFFSGLTLSTDRTGSDSWTASTPHGKLRVKLLSDDVSQFSGQVNYLGYECEFSASTIKTPTSTSSLKPENVLDGTWHYNESKAGGYLYSNGKMSALIPRYFTVCFNDTDSSSTTATTAGFIEIPAATGEAYNEEDSILVQFVDTENINGIRNVYGDIYAMTNAQTAAGITSLLFIQSETQAYMMMNWLQPDGQMCILLPMTKLQESEEHNIAAGLARKWTATRGGGFMIPAADTSTQLNLQLVSCDLSFSNLQFSGTTGSAEISAAGTFSSPLRTVSLDAFKGITIELEELGVNLWRAVTAKGSNVYISLVSENEVLIIADIVYDGAASCLLMAALSPSE